MSPDAGFVEGWMPPEFPPRSTSAPLVAFKRPTAPLPSGRRDTDWHRHSHGQILYIERGVAQVRIARGTWLLPPHRAAWIPPGMMHGATLSGAEPLSWSLFLSPRIANCLGDRPRAISVGSLARSLLQQAVEWSLNEQRQARQRRLMRVLLDELRSAPSDVFHLPMPSDRRLLRIANGILAQPGQSHTLEHWSNRAGVSTRTVNRLFTTEVGMSFMAWRQQAMLLHALSCLSRGESVSGVADSLGYASPSNFIAMFRRCYGDSPTRYLTRNSELP